MKQVQVPGLAGSSGARRMTVLAARWAPGCALAVSVALTASALILAYLDRRLVPASLTTWDFSDVFGTR